MASEFAGVLEGLASRPRRTVVFFRDDDAGWRDPLLKELGKIYIDENIPLDIAVIPFAVSSVTLRVLDWFQERAPDLFHLHQHGCKHQNHQLEGRKSEFGSDRIRAEQVCDIDAGRAALTEYFGARSEPIFTPPWNRCSPVCVEALEVLGFRVLSRDDAAETVCHPRLFEVAVNLDWFKKSRGRPLPAEAWNDYAATVFAEHARVGVMLHHEHMDGQQRDRLRRFIRMLRNSGHVDFSNILTVAADPSSASSRKGESCLHVQ